MTEESCPFAPRHRPGLQGFCTRCGAEVPAPWYLRRQPEPAALAAEIAAKHGVILSAWCAKEIADAVLSYADAVAEVRHALPREAWENLEFREHVEAGLRRQLLEEMAKQGVLPTAPPSRALRFLAGPLSFTLNDGPEVPPGAPYETVEIILAVPVRRPPVDRAAAVKAGIL